MPCRMKVDPIPSNQNESTPSNELGLVRMQRFIYFFAAHSLPLAHYVPFMYVDQDVEG